MKYVEKISSPWVSVELGVGWMQMTSLKRKKIITVILTRFVEKNKYQCLEEFKIEIYQCWNTDIQTYIFLISINIIEIIVSINWAHEFEKTSMLGFFFKWNLHLPVWVMESLIKRKCAFCPPRLVNVNFIGEKIKKNWIST